MMYTISDGQIKEFKRLYKEQFGSDITDEKAREIASQFIDILEATYRTENTDIS